MGRAATTDAPRWWRRVGPLIFPAHLVVVWALTGLRWEYVAASGLLWLATLAGPKGRRFSFLALPIWLTGVAYDNFRYVEHFRSSIHVADLYQAELAWFGVSTAQGPLTLPELFGRHHWPALDLLTGAAYILYLFWPIGLAVWFYFRDQRRMAVLAWAFLVVNVMGMATYLAWPAAPPWYVMDHGLGPAVLDAAPSAAGAARFDALTGIAWFEGFYSRSANVFGAMPSLHVAYPVLVIGVVWGLGRGWVLASALFALLVSFSAIYLGHHYVWDVVMGALYGLLAYGLVAALMRFPQIRAKLAPARAGEHA